MAKIINVDGYSLEPGYLTHNGKRYRYLTVASDRKKILEYVKEFNPDLQKSVVIANVDLTTYKAFGRKTSRIGKSKVTVIKTPVKLDAFKSLTRYRYQGDEYTSLPEIQRYARGTERGGRRCARSVTDARDDVKLYLNILNVNDWRGSLETGTHKTLPKYNEFVILKILDNQYQAYSPEKK